VSARPPLLPDRLGIAAEVLDPLRDHLRGRGDAVDDLLRHPLGVAVAGDEERLGRAEEGELRDALVTAAAHG
jgi:Arc/MetJ family transcription regulator